MDPSRGQRRPNDTPSLHNPNARYQSLNDPSQQQQQQRRSFAGASERYRPAPLNTSPSTPARGMGATASYSEYYQQPAQAGFSTASNLPSATMGYHQGAADYGQDARQSQGYASAYNTAMMYNVPPATNTQSTAVYDASGQPFTPRQPAGMQMMTADVAAPYFTGDQTNPASASALQQQTASTQSPAIYQQSPADRNALLQSYSSGMGTMGGLASQAPSSAADVSMEEQEYPAGGGLDEAYASYQSALKEIFGNIKNGALATASESVLNVSDWLLSHVVELGLTADDQNLHSDRIKLWNDFNHAWLATLQAQKDLMSSGRQLQRGQSLITQEGLEKMGNELVRLCDSIERHGLVDYQYGVWEEQIMDILRDCLSLYDTGDDAPAGGSSSHR